MTSLLPFTFYTILDVQVHCKLALALLERNVAPYVALDIIDMLATAVVNETYKTESEFRHLQKITLITRIQSRLAEQEGKANKLL
jgi:uncharacterized protein (UPF0261 family)